MLQTGNCKSKSTGLKKNEKKKTKNTGIYNFGSVHGFFEKFAFVLRHKKNWIVKQTVASQQALRGDFILKSLWLFHNSVKAHLLHRQTGLQSKGAHTQYHDL